MILIYNILYLFFFIVLIPFFVFRMIFRGKYRAGFLQRFSLYPRRVKRALKEKKVIWVHAVSVGEVNSVVPLIERLQSVYHDHMIVLSTVTNTGQALARKKLGHDVVIVYFPLDFYFFMKRALRLFHPSYVILVEADLWPNLLHLVHKNKILACIINGRLSEKSSSRYSFFHGFFQRLLSSIDLVTVQSDTDRQRFMSIGVKPSRIKIVENLKWEDYLYPVVSEDDAASVKKSLGFKEDDTVLVAGSTHGKEERALLTMYQSLKSDFPNLKLVIAPRHPERFKKVRNILLASMSNFIEWSSLQKGMQGVPSEIVLLDAMGVLNTIYSVGTIAFVGKSLFKKGGQNIIEPARLAKPVVFGPHMENFAYIASQLVDAGAAIQVQDEYHLERVLRDLLSHPEKVEEMGRRARLVVEENRGGFERNFALIKELYRPVNVVGK